MLFLCTLCGVCGGGGYLKKKGNHKLFSRNITVNYSESEKRRGRGVKRQRELGGGGKSKKFMFIFILSFCRHLGRVILSEKIGIASMFSV
jgi:hypothetical protein